MVSGAVVRQCWTGRPNWRDAAGILQPTVWQVQVLGEAKGRAPGLVFPAFTAVSFFLFVWSFLLWSGSVSLSVILGIVNLSFAKVLDLSLFCKHG